MEKYINKYLKQIKLWESNKSLFKDHKIYEILWAIELQQILWDDIPPNFDELFDLPHIMDYGVDLVSLDYNKCTQVKKYNGKSFITWSQICKFRIYAQDILEIDDMYLATTKHAKVDKMAKLKLIDKDKIKMIKYNFDELMDKIMDEYKIVANDDKPKKYTIIKRKYLLECYDVFAKSDKNIYRFQLPCGTGKTYIMLFMIRKALLENNNDRFVILCPWISLAKQTCELFNHFKGIRPVFVGNGKHNIPEKTNVIVCVYNSVDYIQSLKFKYKFIDEAHHLESEDSKLRDKINSIKADKEINFSATFHDQTNLDFNYPMNKAIEDGYISDYALHIEYFTKGDKFNELVNMIKNNMHWSPMFIYFNSTNRCIKFAKKLVEAKINATYMVGSTKVSRRTKIRQSIIDGTLNVLCLCGVYNEGVSIDNLQTVIFGDLRHSSINRIQIAMRANRLHKDKPYYRIVLPVIGDDLQQKDVSDLIKTFNDIDPRIKKAVDNRSRTRIRIKLNDTEINEKKAELLFEEVYNRIGEILNKNDWEDWKNLLFKFCDDNKRVPMQKEKDKNNQSIGIWFHHQKSKINSKDDEIYKKLSVSKYVKKSLDEYLDPWKAWNEWKNSLFEFCNNNKRIPICGEKDKNNKNIGNWLQCQKGKINSKNDEIYKKLSVNKYVKKSLDEYLDPWKVWNEWRDLLFEFCNNNKKVPINKGKYKNKNIGRWLQNQKNKINSKDDEIYKKLSINKYVKKSLGEYLDPWKVWNEWRDLLFEFCDTNKRVPTKREKDKNNKNVGSWLQNQKTKINSENDEIYKKLSANKYVKESLDEYLDPWIVWNKWKNLLFEFCEENKRIPAQREKDRNSRNIGKWLQHQKEKINSKNDEIYEKLSVNQYIKKSLDDYLEYRDQTKNKIKLKWNKWRDLLFEFCNDNKRIPKSTEKNKNNHNIGIWLNDQKKKINSKNNDIYKKLSVNQYVRESLDKYLTKKYKI